MHKIKGVIEYNDSILVYLSKRRILFQYIRVKESILFGNNKDLKIIQPKKEKIYYFRINKQYRAFCKIKDGYLLVFEINNHQN